MPRAPRKKSSSNIYHVMLRGNEQQTIFQDEEDYNKFLSVLDQCRKQFDFVLYAWCLMPNHVHLLIKERSKPISSAVQGIGSSYVFWYNAKYFRTGHLFQGRYKSEPVEDEAYFLQVIRYIHLNPVQAHLCDSSDEYPYSSYNRYFHCGKNAEDLVWGLIRRDEFERFHKEKKDDIRSELEEKRECRLSDDEVRSFVKGSYGNIDLSSISSWQRDKKTEIIQSLLERGASIRQINRLTGVGINVISAIRKNM